MKRSSVILITAMLIVSVIIASATVPAEKASKKKRKADITGTWQMESYKHSSMVNEFTMVPENMPRIKLITEDSFCWSNIDGSGKISSSAGGKYTLEGDQYTESIDYGFNMDLYLGTKSVFTIMLEGDLLFISGKLSTGQKIEQVWHRVK
jgi:hypothetical protein